jgi:hypothetical protein
METLAVNMKGIYRDIITAPDGTVLYDSGWHSNTIVERCRILLAGFIRNDTTSGIQNLQVGQGNAAWDANGAPAPTPGETALVAPAADAPIAFASLEVAYLSSGGTTLPPADPPTPQLQITATLPAGYPAPLGGGSVYPLREFGLFGSFNGTPSMINNVRHPVIFKEASTTLTRIVRLYF